MATLIADMSMSLDGCVADEDDGVSGIPTYVVSHRPPPEDPDPRRRRSTSSATGRTPGADEPGSLLPSELGR
jgi:hypothetical protein